MMILLKSNDDRFIHFMLSSLYFWFYPLSESYFVSLKPSIEAQYKNLKNANFQYSTKGLHFIMYDDKEWYFNQLNNFLSAK